MRWDAMGGVDERQMRQRRKPVRPGPKSAAREEMLYFPFVIEMSSGACKRCTNLLR
jgi:hypothetical protein